VSVTRRGSNWRYPERRQFEGKLPMCDSRAAFAAETARRWAAWDPPELVMAKIFPPAHQLPTDQVCVQYTRLLAITSRVISICD